MQTSSRPWWIAQLAVAVILATLDMAVNLIQRPNAAGVVTDITGDWATAFDIVFISPGVIATLALNGILLAVRRPPLVGAGTRILLRIEFALIAVLVALAFLESSVDDLDGVFEPPFLISAFIWPLLSACAIAVLVLTVVGNSRAKQSRVVAAAAAAGA